MPIYDFECEKCGDRFEELVAAGSDRIPCPACGGVGLRIYSRVSPPSRQPRGPGAKEGQERRAERELARADRISETRRKRAAGEL